MKQRGKADPALPQSFTFRFAPDDYYTDASEESMGLVPMLVDVFFPSFLDAKEYPDAAWRDGMKKGAMIPALGLGGFPSLLGPLLVGLAKCSGPIFFGWIGLRRAGERDKPAP